MATVMGDGIKERRTRYRTLEPTAKVEIAEPPHLSIPGLVTKEMLEEDKREVVAALAIETDPTEFAILEAKKSIIDALIYASKLKGVALDFTRVGFGTKVVYIDPDESEPQTIHILRREDTRLDFDVVPCDIPLVDCFFGSRPGDEPICHGIKYKILSVERSSLTFLAKEVVGTA